MATEINELTDISNILKTAPRLGSDGQDDPEGVRYIQISDTLATNMAMFLDEQCLTLGRATEMEKEVLKEINRRQAQ